MAPTTLPHSLTASLLILLLSTITATATPLTTPLHARNDTPPALPPSSSSCHAAQNDVPTRFGAISVPWSYDIVIAHKTTTERGSPGQGLLDNIRGECHNDAMYPDVKSALYDAQSHALTGYEIEFSMPASLPDTACVQTAISKAEGQQLTC